MTEISQEKVAQEIKNIVSDAIESRDPSEAKGNEFRRSDVIRLSEKIFKIPVSQTNFNRIEEFVNINSWALYKILFTLGLIKTEGGNVEQFDWEKYALKLEEFRKLQTESLKLANKQIESLINRIEKLEKTENRIEKIEKELDAIRKRDPMGTEIEGL